MRLWNTCLNEFPAVDNRGNIEASLCEEIMVKNYREIQRQDFRLKTCAVIKKIKIKTCLNIIQWNCRRTMVKKKQQKNQQPKNYKRERVSTTEWQLDAQKTFHQKQYWPEKKSKIFRMN